MFEKKKKNNPCLHKVKLKKEYLRQLFCKGTELRSVSAVIGALKRGCNNDTGDHNSNKNQAEGEN